MGGKYLIFLWWTEIVILAVLEIWVILECCCHPEWKLWHGEYSMA